jgi:hypothetical protein
MIRQLIWIGSGSAVLPVYGVLASVDENRTLCTWPTWPRRVESKCRDHRWPKGLLLRCIQRRTHWTRALARAMISEENMP